MTPLPFYSLVQVPSNKRFTGKFQLGYIIGRALCDDGRWQYYISDGGRDQLLFEDEFCVLGHVVDGVIQHGEYGEIESMSGQLIYNSPLSAESGDEGNSKSSDGYYEKGVWRLVETPDD
ncbi:hypothetical protein [Austwickia chelonae]|uniref:hypothetical protein n=1 Tax=Austwickia chelonae TaxID=100225 RepID=UPI0013C2BFC0|nr:hypothetical protein [Austwickia chelonae]